MANTRLGYEALNASHNRMLRVRDEQSAACEEHKLSELQRWRGGGKEELQRSPVIDSPGWRCKTKFYACVAGVERDQGGRAKERGMGKNGVR